MRTAQQPESIVAIVAEQSRVVGALMMREIYTRFGRDNIGFLWIIVEPMMFCMGVVGLWHIIKHAGHEEVAITPFVITGYMPLLLFRHITAKLMRCMQANGSLLYHRQVKIISLYMARMLVEFLGTSAAFMTVMILFYAVDMVDLPENPSLMIGGWILYAWFSCSFALVVGAIAERSELVEKIWGPVSYLSIPVSGTFYMLYWMPDSFRSVLEWAPQANGVEMIRGGYYGSGVPTYYDPIYLSYICAILTVIGLYLLSGARKHVELD